MLTKNEKILLGAVKLLGEKYTAYALNMNEKFDQYRARQKKKPDPSKIDAELVVVSEVWGELYDIFKMLYDLDVESLESDNAEDRDIIQYISNLINVSKAGGELKRKPHNLCNCYVSKY